MLSEVREQQNHLPVVVPLQQFHQSLFGPPENHATIDQDLAQHTCPPRFVKILVDLSVQDVDRAIVVVMLAVKHRLTLLLDLHYFAGTIHPTNHTLCVGHHLCMEELHP